MKEYIYEMAQKLIDNNPEEYQGKYCDYGYINNGVGFVSCGGEYEYNEEQAFEDAKQVLLDELDFYAGKNNIMPEDNLMDAMEVLLQDEDVYNLIKTKIESVQW